jgi:hypothetical protein
MPGTIAQSAAATAGIGPRSHRRVDVRLAPQRERDTARGRRRDAPARTPRTDREVEGTTPSSDDGDVSGYGRRGMNSANIVLLATGMSSRSG